MSHFEVISFLARSRNTTARVVESTMTARQVELEFFFMQRDIMRQFKTAKLATIAAIRESFGSS
jgi:hypothetical protein